MIMSKSCRVPPRTFVLLACVVFLASGCNLFGARKEEKARRAAPTLKLGTVIEGKLHCDRKLCKSWYKVNIIRRQPILIEVDAPSHRALPDFGITLETAQLEVVEIDQIGFRRPRTIDKTLEPGLYYLSVWSRGENKDMLSYKVSARAKTRRVSKKRYSRPKKIQKQPRPPPPPPVFVTINADILELERSGGEPNAVLLEASRADGIRPGDRGRLVEGERVIGELEVVDVYDEAIRARIVGGLSAPITFDTRAELNKPTGAAGR